MESQTPLNHKASQETMISLLQLDPQPIESPNEKPLPPLPEQSLESSTSSLEAESKSKSGTSSPHSSALGLSGSSHGPVYYLTRIQRYSSYTFTVFAGLHMVNTSIVPLIYNSVPYSEPFLLMAREIYQTRLSEPLLVGLPIVAHVASGLALRLIRRSQNLKRYGGATPGMYALHRSNTSVLSTSEHSKHGLRIWPQLSYVSVAGYILIPPVVAHIFLNRILPLIVEGDSSNIGLQYVSHGFARHGLQPWIAYALLLTAGAGHFVWGWAKWLNLAPPMNWRKTTVDKALRKRRSRAWWGINGLAALVAGVWAAGGLGVVARGGAAYGWLGKVYDAIYARAGQ
ncbi:hypothetical protein TruAng_010530 [Truncatella angustata]|nr:hypothetical protein TruAng_010530 [Truncatella angustata]